MLLQFGSKGPDVVKLQQFLKVDPVGNFGNKTKAAVIAWQKANNLEPDGVVGDKTWKMMFPDKPTGAPVKPTPIPAAAAPIPGVVHPKPSAVPSAGSCVCDTGLTADIFKAAMGIKGNLLFTHKNMKDNPATYNTPIDTFLKELEVVCQRYQINNCRRKAHFLGQIWLETGSFTTLEEFASGSAYEPGARADARSNGNTTPGDGPKYKGRGCIQLTWKNNYKKYQAYLDQSLPGHSYNIVNDPISVTGNLFLALDTAGWYWRFGKQLNNGSPIDLNLKADAMETDRICVLVNGGGNGKAERIAITNKLLKLFNADKCSHKP